MFFSVLCLLCLCARLFICAFWSPAGKGLPSWLSFVVSYCEFAGHFPIGILGQVWYLLYRFLIFAPLLTLKFAIAGIKEDAKEIRCVNRVLILAQDTGKMNRVTTNIPCSKMLTGKRPLKLLKCWIFACF